MLVLDERLKIGLCFDFGAVSMMFLGFRYVSLKEVLLIV